MDTLPSGIPASAFGTGLPIDADASVPNCWTIDQTSKAAGGADNGFLDCARAHTPGYYSHGSTAEAVANLLRCAGSVPLAEGPQTTESSSKESTSPSKKLVSEAGTSTGNIIGHGNDGLIVTGQGQSPSDPAKFITTWNQNNWGPEIRKLKSRFSIIKLWACHPGTGQDGADLLYAMMLETNAICMGPTGFLYCSQDKGLYLEPNSTWQVSTPGQPKPNPIPAPTRHFVLPIQQIVLQFGRAFQVIDLNSVSSVEVTRGPATLLSLQGEVARHFLGLIDFGSPFEIDGAVGAVVTGQLVLVYTDRQGQQQQAKFAIYNNRLLESLDNPSLHYQCSEGFGQALVLGIR